ncbi:MAG: sulfotransferase family protein, partial [Oscillochloris sp.]|nr:sulfotransferase family protein [Oscillochloris sp.]
NSINQIFREHDPDLVEIVPIAPEKQRTRHGYICDIKAAIAPAMFSSYAKFAVVRNPFDRFVSWYFMFKHGLGDDEVPTTYAHVGNEVMQLVNEHASAFEDFVGLPSDHPSGLFRRFYVPQVDYLAEHGAMLVDHILHFESLSSDFQRFAHEIGFPGQLPHVNRSVRVTDYRSCYNEQTKATIAQRFQPDLAYFGYEF